MKTEPVSPPPTGLSSDPAQLDTSPVNRSAEPSDGSTEALAELESRAGINTDEMEDIASLDMEDLLSAPVVEAASRRAQSIHESPAAITLIDSDDIEAMRVQEVPNLLYRAVGVDILQKNPRVYAIGMRGYNDIFNNRVLTLLDGRNIADVSPFEAPAWDLLPIHPSELQRVEIIRGLGSTLYGANAFSGVISLKTRRPLDHPGTTAEVATGLTVWPSTDNPSMVRSLKGSAADRATHQQGMALLSHRWASADRRRALGISFSLGQAGVRGQEHEYAGASGTDNAGAATDGGV